VYLWVFDSCYGNNVTQGLLTRAAAFQRGEGTVQGTTYNDLVTWRNYLKLLKLLIGRSFSICALPAVGG